jgi:hypothetical protein
MTTRQLSGFRNFKFLKSRCLFNRLLALTTFSALAACAAALARSCVGDITGKGIVNGPDLGYLLNA